MQTVTLKFDVSGQNLIAGNLTRYASNTVNYVKAVFDLDGNWNSFDSVRAVWSTDFECISTVLDSEGVCYVPQEVLKRTGNVTVNLVGSIAENDELTDRLTTYPVVALVINANAKVCGTETAEVTPSQFEQYVAMVAAEVEKVTGMTATAVALPEGSAPTAVYENGVLTLGIPKGDKGETGNGISSVEFNADYSLTFNFTESEPYTTPSIRGERGAQGYGIVSVEKIGTAGLVDTYQVNYEDPSVPPTTFTVTNGAKGDTGNGISSVTKTGTVGLVDTYRITFTNGGHYDFNVTNGAKGDTGATGNGIATIAKTSTSGLVDTYTITFTDGTSTTFEVTNGQDGEVTYDELSELLPTETASGDIASFNDGQAVIPAVSVVATITPIQSGSGTPSPSNVRPISGHDDVTVTVADDVDNPTVSEDYTTTLPSTTYGGTLDLVSGELVVDRAIVDLSTLTWRGSSGIKLSTDIANVVKAPSANNIPANIVAEKYATSAVAPISANDGKIGIEATGARGRIQCGSSETPSGMLVYELATPQTYQLTPQQIDTLKGQNNITATSGQVSVTYKADIQKYIDNAIATFA